VIISCFTVIITLTYHCYFFIFYFLFFNSLFLTFVYMEQSNCMACGNAEDE